MQLLKLANTEKKNYRAKYSVEYFERIKIPSYALWGVCIKQGRKYGKIPAGYGQCETLEEANLELTAWLQNHGIGVEDIRQDIIPWRLVKDLLDGKSGAEFFAREVKRPEAVSAQFGYGLVFADKGTAFTTSVIVAEKFKKKHKNVIQTIENLPHDEFWRLNFQPRDYIDERGKVQPMYEIAWKGFSMLVMGFNGNSAYQWKKSFLDAFESMGDLIYRHKERIQSDQWKEARGEASDIRLSETETVKRFVEYATAQGSKNAGRYYQNITKGTYAALFILEHGGKWEGCREFMSQFQLTWLAVAEKVAQKALAEAMGLDMFYKDAYQFAIGKVKDLAGMVGVTKIEKIPDYSPLKLVKQD
jgi:Rha family phage regulatory protein